MSSPQQQQPQGLAAIYIDIPPESKPDFAKWCDAELLPNWRTLPGVVSAARFEAVEGSPNTLVLCELATIDALSTPKYLDVTKQSANQLGARLGVHDGDQQLTTYRLRLSRATAEGSLSNARVVVATRLFVKPGHEAETRAWLDEEHSERQLTVPGALAYYGYEPLQPPFHYLNMWALESPEVQASVAWAEAAKTQRRDQVMQSRDKLVRGVYRRS